MITQRYLKKNFIYCQNLGEFYALNNINKLRRGSICGNLNNLGYVYLSIDQKPYLAHRLAWLYMTGDNPQCDIDHINHIPSDNRWINLREVTHKDNLRNCKLSKNNSSGVNGVIWDKSRNKWQSRIKVDYKTIHLGRFENFKDACDARHQADIRYGFHENHGKTL